MADSYLYEPLDRTTKEIRLLEFFSKTDVQDSSLLRCSMKKVRLIDTQVPVYTAVSYCWGDAGSRKDIIIDDIAVSIPGNAEIALRHLHFEHVASGHWRTEQHSTQNKGSTLSNLIWIDSVCINQQNLAERGDQVSIMAQIYLQAEQVLIWLGEDQIYPASAAVASIHGIVDHCKLHTKDLQTLENVIYSRSDQKKTVDISMDLPENIDWLALRLFFSSPWFSRLWTVQEVVLAKRAVLFRGQTTIDFMSAAAAAMWLEYLEYQRKAYPEIWGMTTCAIIGKLRLRPQVCQQVGQHPGDCRKGLCLTGFSVSYVLSEISKRQAASEPRDKLYGVFGLFADYLTEDHIPTYDQSLVDTYKYATFLAIASTGDLAILITARSDEREHGEERDLRWYITHDWPTWVPFFDVTYLYTSNYTAFRQAHIPPAQCLACGSEKFAKLAQPLSVAEPFQPAGVRVGSIVALSRVFPYRPFDWSIDELAEAVQHIGDIASRFAQIARDTFAEALGITMLFGYGPIRAELLTREEFVDAGIESLVNDLLERQTSHSFNVKSEPGGEGDLDSLVNMPPSPGSPGSSSANFSSSNSQEADNMNLNDVRNEQGTRNFELEASSQIVEIGFAAEGEMLPGLDNTLNTLDQQFTHDDVQQMMSDVNFQSGVMSQVYDKPWNPAAQIALNLEGRRLCVTSDGYMGLLPSDTKEGDIATILFGSSLPIVLRPGNERQDLFYLIGPCYVHGIMAGEMIEELQKSGTLDEKTEWFELR